MDESSVDQYRQDESSVDESSADGLTIFHRWTNLPWIESVQLARPCICKCNKSQYMGCVEHCIGHVSSSIHNRSPFIPLSSDYNSRVIHCHSLISQITVLLHLNRSIPRSSLSLNLCSHTCPTIHNNILLSISLTTFLFMCPHHLKTLLKRSD